MSRLAVLLSLTALAAPAGAETLHVLALDSEPFFYQRADGSYAGIEYDILDYFAKSRDATLEVEFVDSFGSILDRIEKREADLAAGTITITPEREKRVSFSASYFPVQVVLVERAGERTKTLGDLVGQKVAAFARTTADDALRAVPGILVINEGTLEDHMTAVDRGELRAAAADSSAIIPELEKFPRLKIGLPLSGESGFGFALPMGSPLTGPLTETVRKLKQSGIYFRIVTEHMGPRASEIIKGGKIE